MRTQNDAERATLLIDGYAVEGRVEACAQAIREIVHARGLPHERRGIGIYRLADGRHLAAPQNTEIEIAAELLGLKHLETLEAEEVLRAFADVAVR